MVNGNTYPVKGCACYNCDFEGDVNVPKGKKLDEAICETCGNAGGLYRKPQSSSYYDFPDGL